MRKIRANSASGRVCPAPARNGVKDWCHRLRYLQAIPTYDATGHGYAKSVRVIGRKAYMADGEAGVCILDIESRQALLFIPTHQKLMSVGYAEDLDISGNTICVANGEGGWTPLSHR